ITESESSSDYYHIEYDKFVFEPNLKFRIGENFSLEVGPSYRMINVNENPDRFYSSVDDSLSYTDSEQSHYLGVVFEADIRTIESRHDTKKGIRSEIVSAYYHVIDRATPRFAQIKTNFSAYYTFNFPLRTTIAARIGGATNAGEYAFYDGNSIGGNEGFSRPG